MVRDLIPEFRKRKIITADALNRLRIDATQQQGGPGLFIDGTGAYQRPKRRRERGIWFKPDTDVPANGVMYVTDNDTTQGELVLTTKKPDGIALGEIIVVNGPEDVASGVYGKCFMFGDVPIQASVASSETVANGDVLGPKSSQWDLYKDFPGLIAFSAKDSDGLAWCRLQQDPTMDIELKNAMPSSGSVSAGQQATAYRLKPDGSVDTSTEVEVFDELGVFRGKAYVSGSDRGSKGVVSWHSEEDRVQILTLQPHALRISGVTSSEVTATTTQFTLSGTPVIMNPSGALFMEVLTTANLIKNPLGLVFESGDTIHAEWNENATTPQWEAVVPNTYQARWLQFTASADFLTGGAIAIDARTYFDGFDPGTDITSILNPLNLTGYDNTIGVAQINTNVTPPTYTAFNVAPVAEDVLTDFNVNGATFKLQMKTRPISIMPRGDETALTDIHTGDDCP